MDETASQRMRSSLPETPQKPLVKLTPITKQVAKAKKGLAVHECDICQPPKNFTRAEHLRRHQLSHKSPDLACYVPGCNKVFYRDDLLERHQERHAQEQLLEDSAASASKSHIPPLRLFQPWVSEDITQQVAGFLKSTLNISSSAKEHLGDSHEYRPRVVQMYWETTSKLDNLIQTAFKEGGSITATRQPHFLNNVILALSDGITEEVIWANIPQNLLFRARPPRSSETITPSMLSLPSNDDPDLSLWRSLVPEAGSEHHKQMPFHAQSDSKDALHHSLSKRVELAQKCDTFLQSKRGMLEDLKQQICSTTYGFYSQLFSIEIQKKVHNCLQAAAPERCLLGLHRDSYTVETAPLAPDTVIGKGIFRSPYNSLGQDNTLITARLTPEDCGTVVRKSMLRSLYNSPGEDDDSIAYNDSIPHQLISNHGSNSTQDFFDPFPVLGTYTNAPLSSRTPYSLFHTAQLPPPKSLQDKWPMAPPPAITVPVTGTYTDVPVSLYSLHHPSEPPPRSSQDKSSMPPRPAITVRTLWDPFRLMRRAKVEDPSALLGHLVSVTGDWELAQAERCRDYVIREWCREGEEILSLLEEIVETHSQLGLPVVSQNDNKQVISRFHQLPGAIINPANAIRIAIVFSNVPNTTISLEGSQLEVEVVVKLIAWLSATFYNPHMDTPQLVRVSLEVRNRGLEVDIHHLRGQETCWLPMLERVHIAHGFPIHDRDSQRGIQMSMEMAATLIGATRLTVFDGGIVMLGYAGILLPVRIVAKTVQWHFVPSDSLDEPMTYAQGIADGPDRLMITDLADFEQVCYIGWHPEATSRVAQCFGGIEYSKIRKSGLGDPSSRIRLKNVAIGFQQVATFEVGIDLVPYQSPRFYQMKRRRYESILRQLAQSRVLMYDVNTDRAWLLSAADVALHLIQYRLCHCPIPLEGCDVTTLELLGTSVVTLRRSAAIELEKGYSIQDMVINTWESFEHLQSELRTQSTGEIMLSFPGRNNLLGFEYTALAEERSNFELREASFKGLFMKGPTWVDLIQADKPLVLFGNNFGELVALGEASQRNTCALWRRVPSGVSLMTVTGEVLRQMYDEEPGGKQGQSTNPSLTSQKLEWHQGSSKLFESCTTPLHLCSCQRTQSLAIRKSSSSAKVLPPTECPTVGAIIFGLADRVKRPALVAISPKINLPDCPSERQLSKRPIASLFSRSRTASSHIDQALRSDSAILMEGIETERLR